MAVAGVLRSPGQALLHGSSVGRGACQTAASRQEPSTASCRFLTGSTGAGQLQSLASSETARWQHSRVLVPRASVQSKRGFGAPKPQTPPKKKSTAPKKGSPELVAQEDESGRPEEEDEDDSVPEVVTDRMLKRISFTVGVPLAVGLGFFPVFYWLKVVKKIDLPEWVPFLASIGAFGTAALGISYGILSTSWDPRREGTLLGWKEAKINWPVFWSTLRRDKK